MIVAATVCWLIFAVLVNVTIGNRRSITAPKKQDPSKMQRRQASQLSALLSIGVILLVAGLGAGIIFLGSYLGMPWASVGVLLVLAGIAAAFYVVGLNKLDALASANRETMIEELCKAS